MLYLESANQKEKCHNLKLSHQKQRDECFTVTRVSPTISLNSLSQQFHINKLHAKSVQWRWTPAHLLQYFPGAP
ncbi:hypothetical protein E2320_002343 [Naja naja]|nr:hypothetical protein E2320_002343 [Naja naja]